MKHCTNLNCAGITDTDVEDFDKCLNRACGKFRGIEEIFLHCVLQMAQQSLDPELYGGFLMAYNALIEVRNLGLRKIDI
jgi:hypothetical protein